MKNIDKYFEKNLGKKSYDFLLQLVESGQYSWEEIKRKVDIENKEIVWRGDLDIEGTNVKKIKAKIILGSIFANSVESLKEIEVEEIGGDLYIWQTNKDFQLKVEEKIENGELEVKGEILFGQGSFKSLNKGKLD